MRKTRWLVLLSAVIVSASTSRAIAAYAHKAAQADEVPAGSVSPPQQAAGAQAPHRQVAGQGHTSANTGATGVGSQTLGVPDDASLPPLPPPPPAGPRSERAPLRALDPFDPWNVHAPLAAKSVHNNREVDLVDPWDHAASPRTVLPRPMRARLGLDVVDPWSTAP